MKKPSQLFVDGHNVLHALGWLREGGNRSALAVARARLIEAVRAIHDVDGVVVTIVFDGRADSIAHDVAQSSDDFAVIYAPANRTADDVIERSVATSAEPGACVVATADQLERETVRASGAECISPAELEAWIGRCRARTAAKSRATGQNKFENKLPL